MTVCPYCGYEDVRPGMYFCDNCANKIQDADPGTSEPNDEIHAAAEMISEKFSPTKRDCFSNYTCLKVYVRDAQNPLVIYPEKRMTIGRVDNQKPDKPDVDLTRYRALEQGVSRLHAMLTRREDDIVLTDVGSSNGIYVNGKRLREGQSYVVCDGDEVIFGRLVTNFYFD